MKFGIYRSHYKAIYQSSRANKVSAKFILQKYLSLKDNLNKHCLSLLVSNTLQMIVLNRLPEIEH